MIHAVLLDLDDTLFDHRHGARQALGAVREIHAGLAAAVAASELEQRHARILDVLHLRVLAGEIGLDDARLERFRQLFEGAGISADAGLVQLAATTYRDCYVRSRREVQGATALLRALKRRARVGIVTNNLAHEQRDKVRFCGFDPYLDVMVISEEAGVCKPDPAIFRIALERIGVAADNAVMVGDAWHTDIAGARAAGLRAVWFNPLGASRPEPWPEVAEISALEPPAAVLAEIFGSEERRAS